MLLGRVPVRQIAADDHELGGRLCDESPQIVLDFRLLPCSRVQIRELEHAYGRHRAGRL
jgi:hypothetical protein